MSNFHIITDDVMISHIFPFFTTEEIVHILGLVSLRFHALTEQNHIWKILITRRFTLKYDMSHDDATQECYKRKRKIFRKRVGVLISQYGLNDFIETYGLRNLPLSAKTICWIALNDVIRQGEDFRDIPNDLKDFEMCYFAVKIDPINIRFVPRTLEKYEEIALCCVRFDPSRLSLVPEEKRTSKVCRYCISRMDFNTEKRVNAYGTNPFSYVPTTLEDFDEICVIAVRKNGHLLKFVIPCTTKDFDTIASEAMIENGDSLEFVPVARRSFELCMLAAHSGGRKQFTMSPYRRRTNPSVLKHVPDKFLNFDAEDEEGRKHLKKCREMWKLALKKNGGELMYVNSKYRDEEICCIALLSSPYAIEFVPRKLRESVKENMYKYMFKEETETDKKLKNSKR